MCSKFIYFSFGSKENTQDEKWQDNRNLSKISAVLKLMLTQETIYKNVSVPLLVTRLLLIFDCARCLSNIFSSSSQSAMRSCTEQDSKLVVVSHILQL